jgi:hypothetical protein
MRTVSLLFALLVSVAAAGQIPEGTCSRSVTFAVAANGALMYRLPNVSTKWFEKAQKKFPRTCFIQHSGASLGPTEQYLIVLSTGSSAFNGLYPVYETRTSTNTSPTSGTGTITDNSGSTWNYTYQGQITTTTTTNEQENFPYTDTTLELYATAYDENGGVVGSAHRAETFRQGGDASNTLGYNIGSRLASIHLKERLLDEIVGRVNSIPPKQAIATVRVEENPPSGPMPEAAERVPAGLGEDVLWKDSEIGVSNLHTFANDHNLSLPSIDNTASTAVIKCLLDAKSTQCFDNWTLAQKSFGWLTELGSAIRAAKSTKDPLLDTVADDLETTWSKIRNVYCRESPGASYTDLHGGIASCGDPSSKLSK